MLLLVDLVCRSLLLDDCNPSVMLTHSVMARYHEGEVQLGQVGQNKLSDRALHLTIAQIIDCRSACRKEASQMGRGGMKSPRREELP